MMQRHWKILFSLRSKFIRKSGNKRNLCFLKSLENFNNRKLADDLHIEMLKSRNYSFERWPILSRKNIQNIFFWIGLIVPSDLLDGVRNTRIFQKWPHCGWSTQVKKYKDFFKNGLIVMGCLSMWKNTRIFWNGLTVTGDLSRWKNTRIFHNGLIVI
jgi:hypothetical protein